MAGTHLARLARVEETFAGVAYPLQAHQVDIDTRVRTRLQPWDSTHP